MSEAQAPIEFDGPPTWHCFWSPYVVLSHGGVKPEGESCPGGLCETAEEAWEKFNARLAEYTKDTQQIAWRRRASCEEQDGKFKVTARLARFPQDYPHYGH